MRRCPEDSHQVATAPKISSGADLQLLFIAVVLDFAFVLCLSPALPGIYLFLCCAFFSKQLLLPFCLCVIVDNLEKFLCPAPLKGNLGAFNTQSFMLHALELDT